MAIWLHLHDQLKDRFSPLHINKFEPAAVSFFNSKYYSYYLGFLGWPDKMMFVIDIFICYHGSLSTESGSWKILSNNSSEIVQEDCVEQLGKSCDVLKML